MKTLLLSANYFPIRIISWERAIKMRFEETADVVAEYSTEVSSPSVTWKIPAVVRERRAAKIKHAIRFSRSNVYLRDGHRCQYCGKVFPPKLLTYDHVIPRCEGGKTNWQNIVTSCGGFATSCNARKGGRDPDSSGFFPLNKPVAPKWLPVVGPRIDRATAPVEWLAFLPA